jgi:trans-aconitate methyltransferase
MKQQASNKVSYTKINRYWQNATPSILGPYMMDGLGFPASAGQFRFQAECKIVKQLLQDQGINYNGLLDLGCGIGYWTEYFARQFTKVTAVEASPPLFEAMVQRCSTYPNVNSVQGDVLLFEPAENYSMVFLGGMLMYLNEHDVVALLCKLIPFLLPGGIILCRETTVREGTVIRDGTYQAVYRSIQTYMNIFEKCNLKLIKTETNLPYNLLQMGCESMEKWQKITPKPLQAIPIVGRLAYWGLRLCNPWITRVPAVFNSTFPELTNHFFLLRASNNYA